MAEKVQIGNVCIGDDFPAVFAAELGTFYNKNIDLAIEFVDKSIAAGADIIKTEILHDADVCLKKAGSETTYNYQGGKQSENYRRLIERKTLPLEDYKKIIDYVKSKNIPIIASIYDFEGADFFVGEGGDAIKLWRNNLDNYSLIKYCALKNLPIIFDAANVYLDEIAYAVRIARQNGAGGAIVNYHPGHNPTPAEHHNLRLMQTYKDFFKTPVGLSCHYRGDEILYAAVGAGCNLIEKGVFSNPDEMEQNVITAASFDELKNIIDKIKKCSAALGSSMPIVEEPRNNSISYGLSAKKDIAAGEKLSFENIKFAFPALGIHAKHWEIVADAKAKINIRKGDEVNWGDLEL